MQPGVQRCGVEPVLSVADPLDGDLTEDGEVGPGPGLVEPGQDLRRLIGTLAGDRQRRPQVAVTGGGQERSQQGESHGQDLPEDELLDLMDRLLLVGSVPDALDEGPEDAEGLVDVAGAALLLGGGAGDELDEGCGGGEHERGSSPLRDHPEGRDYPGMYRRERAFLNPCPTSTRSITRS